MHREEIDQFIRDHLGRKLLVIGCNTGADAHTVGIDAIMNMKGYAGDDGLERYQMLDARNLGSQVSVKELIDFTENLQPDIVLISKVITQRNIHLKDLKDFMEHVEQRHLRERRLFIVGGPRITNKKAMALGYDAGFGPGTTASRVASFFVQEWKKRGWS
jgi:beta-lysine 5,6-aminomutase beta subunit